MMVLYTLIASLSLGKNNESILLFPAAPTGAAVFVIPPAPCRPERSRKTYSHCRPRRAHAACHPDRAKRAEESVTLTHTSSKEEWKRQRMRFSIA